MGQLGSACLRPKISVDYKLAFSFGTKFSLLLFGSAACFFSLLRPYCFRSPNYNRFRYRELRPFIIVLVIIMVNENTTDRGHEADDIFIFVICI